MSICKNTKNIRTGTNNIFETSDTIILRTIQNLKLKPLFERHKLFFYWPQIVGADMARYIKPQRFQFKILYVHAYSSVWANNFQYLKMDVIQKINKYMGDNIVRDIQFTRLSSQSKKYKKILSEKKVNLSSFLNRINLSLEDNINGDFITEGVSDKELKNKLKNVYLKGKKLCILKQKCGWVVCKRCGRLTPPGDTVCINCKRKIKQECLEKITDIFQAIPWARYQDIVKYVQCDIDMVNKQRQRLVQYKAGQLVPDVDYPDFDKTVKYSEAAKRVVMLYRSISPDKITDVIIADTIYKLRFDTSYRMHKKKR